MRRRLSIAIPSLQTSSPALALSTLLTALSTPSTLPSTSATKPPYRTTRSSYQPLTTSSLRALSSAISASCASWVVSMPFIRGSSETSSADRAGSGTGTSEVTAVSAETVLGKDEAKERTVARSAGTSSWAGGEVGEGEVKNEGCVRSDVSGVSGAGTAGET